MNNSDFENLLNNIPISKKEFAEATNLPYQSVMNWKRNDIFKKNL